MPESNARNPGPARPSRDQGQVKAHPVECDQPERKHDTAFVGFLRETCLTVSGPAERPQQPQLVGRALLVVENDMPEQGQGTGAVIRQAQRDTRPGDVRSTLLIRRFRDADYNRAQFARKLLQFGP
jgi:hypothetical protein